MDKEAQKKAAAEVALQYIKEDMVIGVGTGSTVGHFIAGLKACKQKIEGAVASSKETAERLRAIGIPLLDLNGINELPLYVDSADEINGLKQMLKGGGGALTREKIIATVAKHFVCIVDDSKQATLLGQFPVAVEVIPMARSYVARQIVQLGGDPVYREGKTTDNGNVILDIYNLSLVGPRDMEATLKGIVGVVENGIFAKRPADTVLVGTVNGVVTL